MEQEQEREEGKGQPGKGAKSGEFRRKRNLGEAMMPETVTPRKI